MQKILIQVLNLCAILLIICGPQSFMLGNSKNKLYIYRTPISIYYTSQDHHRRLSSTCFYTIDISRILITPK